MARRKTSSNPSADSALISENPDWYQVELAGGVVVDVRTIADSLFTHNPHVWQAFKYIARAGRKPGVPYEADIRKAINYLTHTLEQMDKGYVPCVSVGEPES